MPPLRHRPVIVAAALLACAALAACGTPPELSPPAGDPVPSPGTERPPAGSATAQPGAPAGIPPVTPSPTGFPESYAVDCGGQPTGAAVIKVVRRNGSLLPAGAQVSVETGPLCSGSWQYTVLSVPGREPLAVVTRGRPAALSLVTAGTDVCSVPVRAAAPPGIRSAATCG